jgi:hypothetical protein
MGLGTQGMLWFNIPEESYVKMELKDISEAALQAVIDAEQWVEA